MKDIDIWALVGLAAPATFGAIVGARYRNEQTMRQRGWAFVISVGLGIIGAGVSGEVWHFGPWVTAAISVGISVIGQDVVGAAIVIGEKMRVDPFGTIKAWWNLWWNRSGA